MDIWEAHCPHSLLLRMHLARLVCILILTLSFLSRAATSKPQHIFIISEPTKVDYHLQTYSTTKHKSPVIIPAPRAVVTLQSHTLSLLAWASSLTNQTPFGKQSPFPFPPNRLALQPLVRERTSGDRTDQSNSKTTQPLQEDSAGFTSLFLPASNFYCSEYLMCCIQWQRYSNSSFGDAVAQSLASQ